MEGVMVMFVRHPPGKVHYEGDRPVALLGVGVAASPLCPVDLPLGLPTTSARSRRGTWALYPLGPEVVVVHPGGAVSGPPAEVAAEVGRLATHDRQGELDRQAAKTIQHLLTGDGLDRAGPRRRGARTWSLPAKAYWISGPYNHHGQPAARMPDHAAASRSNDHGIDPAIHAASPPDPASAQAASSHLPQRSVHRPRHDPRFTHKERLTAKAAGGKPNMKIMAVCSNCQRDLLLSQLVEGPEITGSCPWCGTLLAPHYTVLLADAARRAERAGAELVRALGRLGEDWARLHIRPESVLDPIREQLGVKATPSRPVLRQAA
jgi:hypothetical protein